MDLCGPLAPLPTSSPPPPPLLLPLPLSHSLFFHHFFLSLHLSPLFPLSFLPPIPPDKTVKLWKISERCRRYSNLNTVTDDGMLREEQSITQLRIPVKVQDDISIEAMPRRIFANAHTYHINSISVNSDDCTYLSADDLRVNLWDLERTDQSFSILIHMTYSLIHRQQALGMRLHSSLLMCCLSNTIRVLCLA